MDTLLGKLMPQMPPSSILLSILLIILIPITIKWLMGIAFPATTAGKRFPPSPRKLPIVGNLHQLGMHPHKTLLSLAKQYGPLMLLHFGKVPVLVVSSVEYAREIFKTHDLAFSDRPKSAIAEKLLYNKWDILTAPYGEYWRQIRSICVLQLLSNKKVQSFSNVRYEELDILMEKIEKSNVINLSDALASFTNAVICRAALGRKYEEDEGGKSFKRMLREYVELLGCHTNIGDYIPGLAWINKINGLDARVEKVAKEFDCFLEEVVEERTKKLNKRENTTGDDDNHNKDFVDLLLEVQRDGGSAGFPLSKVTIKAIILDIFGGGTDTTYTVLEWAMTQLLRHPKVMQQLQAEVRRTTNGKARVIEEDLGKMHYLKAVIKETFRLNPPDPLLVPRQSNRDVKINGYDIEAGTTAIINIWAIGQDSSLWDKPEEFRPERFLNSAIDYKGHDFELIPFGAGRRGCPGTSFAMTTNELVLANLVNKFDWSLPKGTIAKDWSLPKGAAAEDMDMSETAGITIHRTIPLFAIGTPHVF